MYELTLIGIGTGNPHHLTTQAAAAIVSADLILIPRKGEGKEDLADLRHQIIAQVCDGNVPLIAEVMAELQVSRIPFLSSGAVVMCMRWRTIP